MKGRVLSGFTDILVGLVPLALFVAIDSYLHVGADMRKAMLMLAILCLGAGFLRGLGAPASTLLKALLVGSGCVLALIVVGWNAVQPAVLGLLLSTTIRSTFCGVRVRRLLNAGNGGSAALMLFVPLAVLAVIAISLVPSLMARIATRETNLTAPTVSISTLEGQEVNSSDFRNHVVIIDYWATWCLPCRGELSQLEKLYRRYEGSSKVSFWAVDIQEGGETPRRRKPS
jgi:hypothetical protein